MIQLKHVIFVGLAAIAMQFDIPSMGQPALANAATLTTEQVADFQSKLEQAEASRELLGRYNVQGPPSLLWIGADGEERRSQRITGEVDAAGFLHRWNITRDAR